MIYDTTIDIKERTTSSGIGSGSEEDWSTSREDNVPAKGVKRSDLPDAKELIGDQRKVQYEKLYFIDRYDSGTERVAVDTDHIIDDDDSKEYEVQSTTKSNLQIIYLVREYNG